MRYVYILPVNCFYGDGLNTLLTHDKEVFDNTNDRKILYYNVNESKFRMKSGDVNTPYLEPVLYGVYSGDLLTVEFEARRIQGDPVFSLNLASIKSDGTVQGEVNGYNVPITETWFKYYKVVIPCNRNVASDMVGLYFNFRNNTKSTVMDIRNIRVKVDSVKTKFEPRLITYSLCCAKDFRQMIVNAGTISDKYAQLKNNTTLQNGVISCSGNGFKGVACDLHDTSYNNPVIVSFEYKNLQGNLYVGATSNNTQLTDTTYELPRATDWTKVLRRVKLNRKVTKDVTIEIGSSNSEDSFQLRNVKIIDQRFDDELF